MPILSSFQRALPLALLLAALPVLAAPPLVQLPDDESSWEQDEPLPDDDALRTLDTVVVSGFQPGPGLWKVSRDGNVLWVLGTLAPLPKRMEWDSGRVEARIAASGVVLLSPRVRVKAKGAALGGVFLIPSAMRARNNPDNQRLEDVLPPADYARWEVMKARYLGRDRGVEKRRPILAAMEVREKAFDRTDLTWRDLVGRVVEKAAKRNDVPLERPTVTVEVENARAALKEFAGSDVDDLECFRLTLDQVDRDLGTLATRANAWAMGEVSMLRDLPYTDNTQACVDALLGSGLARRSGFTDLAARVEEAWLAAAEAALAEHPESFAVLPMSRIIGGRTYLQVLEERGYIVQAPAN